MITYKVLGQVCPTSNTGALTPLYTVPTGASAVLSSITVCDVAGGGGTFSVSISVNGAADDPKQYIYGGQTVGMVIDPQDTFIATIGITLAAGDTIYVRSFSVNPSEIAFQAFGAENS
jgi:hypothetical protein